jgi:hypothetical protein
MQKNGPEFPAADDIADTGTHNSQTCSPWHFRASFEVVSTLSEIESALNALPLPEQKELFRRLAERLQDRQEVKRCLPLVPATGRLITQQEIDDALDAD